jgi:SAM-dependent methyltransferase
MCRVAAEKGTGVAQADMRMLPFPLHTFDGVWSSASLLHLDDQAFVVAVGELRDIAKPGGLLYIGVKERVEGIPETQWIDIDKNEPRWYRYWTEAELREVFTDAGLTVEHLSRNEQIAGAGAPFINWYLRTPNDQ